MVHRIGKELAQQIVDTVKDVSGFDVNFMDTDGTIVASTDEGRIGDFHEVGRQAARAGKTIMVEEDDRYRGARKGVNMPVVYNQQIVAVVGLSGSPDEVGRFASLAVKITRLLIGEQELEAGQQLERTRMNYAVRSLIHGDVSNREYLESCLRDLKFDREGEKAVVLARVSGRGGWEDAGAPEGQIAQMLFRSGCGLYRYNYPNEYVGIGGWAEIRDSRETLRAFAGRHQKALSIAIGVPGRLERLALSYEAAAIAMRSLEAGEGSFADANEMDMDMLAGSVDKEFGRLFVKRTVGALGAEERMILDVYFNENLSLSRASEKLFIHKNTLQYRLGKIAAKTGLDPRVFADGAALYLGLRVSAFVRESVPDDKKNR